MPVAILPPGSRIYVAGQAEKGKDLAEATRRTLESLRATLKFLGRDESDVVQLKAFVTPVTDVATVHREMARFFTKAPVPPVAFVEWQSTLPIEIELIAWGGRDRKGPAVEYLTPPGMTASPIYSRVARTNNTDLVYIAGLQAREAAGGEAEVKEVFESLGTLLPRVGSDFRHLVKATYYVATDEASSKLNELRPRYYDPKRPPSASKAAVAGVGRPGRGLSVDMIAVPVGK
jgi:enamine deaminase RidA (YjgF/YER057c/UK114 family)